MVSREKTRKFKSRLICWLALGKHIDYLGFSKERLGLASWGQLYKRLYRYTVKELLSAVGYSRLRF